MNSAAERSLGRDVRVVRRRLCPVDLKAADALDRALDALTGPDEATSVITPILVPRANRRPLIIGAMQPPTVCKTLGTPCQIVLLLIDLDTPHFPSDSVLKTYFGLSTAEARLAQRLASGEALEDAAKHLCISKHTARVQLRAVFAKMNVHRQGELVALLVKLIDLPNPAAPA